jgi:hypothetical protein
MNNLFIQKKTAQCFCFVKDFVKCDFCEEKIWTGDSIVVKVEHLTKKSIVVYYCFKCVGKHEDRQVGSQSVITIFKVVNKLPPKCVVFSIEPRDLTDARGSVTVWETATSNDGIKSDTSGCEVVDNTKLAGRKVPKIDMVKNKELLDKRLAELDSPFKKEDFPNFMGFTLTAKPAVKKPIQPLIENAQPDKLEDKSDKDVK